MLINSWSWMSLCGGTSPSINTLKVLFQYTRLPFGVAFAPQLKGIEHVCVYIDDILVTGRSEADHLQKLEEVLERLSKAGMKLKCSSCCQKWSTWGTKSPRKSCSRRKRRSRRLGRPLTQERVGTESIPGPDQLLRYVLAQPRKHASAASSVASQEDTLGMRKGPGGCVQCSQRIAGLATAFGAFRPPEIATSNIRCLAIRGGCSPGPPA